MTSLHYDLRAAEDFFIERFGRESVRTGFAATVSDDEYGLIVSEPILAADKGVAPLGAQILYPTGEAQNIDVVLSNHSHVTRRMKRGDVIARLIFVKAGGRA